MLDYSGDDFEEVFGCVFSMSHTDIFGQVLTHELKANGGEIAVTKDNKQVGWNEVKGPVSHVCCFASEDTVELGQSVLWFGAFTQTVHTSHQ